MNRIHSILSRTLVATIPAGMAVGMVASHDALAQVVYVAPPAPPAAYVAVNPPEYYRGHAVYLYNNNWYYRDLTARGATTGASPRISTSDARIGKRVVNTTTSTEGGRPSSRRADGSFLRDGSP